MRKNNTRSFSQQSISVTRTAVKTMEAAIAASSSKEIGDVSQVYTDICRLKQVLEGLDKTLS